MNHQEMTTYSPPIVLQLLATLLQHRCLTINWFSEQRIPCEIYSVHKMIAVATVLHMNNLKLQMYN